MDGLEDEQRARKKERAKEEEKLRALQGHLKQGLVAARGSASFHAKKVSDPWLINMGMQITVHQVLFTDQKTSLTCDGYTQLSSMKCPTPIASSPPAAKPSSNPNAILAPGKPTSSPNSATPS